MACHEELICLTFNFNATLNCTRVSIFWKIRVFCFDWTVRNLSGNFAVWQGIFCGQMLCRVESRRRCVLNSQLAHDDCRRKFGNWTCWEFILCSWVELSCVSGVYVPVGCRDPVYNFAANGVGLEVAGSRLTTAVSRLRSHRQHHATRLNCTG